LRKTKQNEKKRAHGDTKSKKAGGNWGTRRVGCAEIKILGRGQATMKAKGPGQTEGLIRKRLFGFKKKIHT